MKLLTSVNELFNASGQIEQCHFGVDFTENEFLLSAMKTFQIQDALEIEEIHFDLPAQTVNVLNLISGKLRIRQIGTDSNH